MRNCDRHNLLGERVVCTTCRYGASYVIHSSSCLLLEEFIVELYIITSVSRTGTLQNNSSAAPLVQGLL